ncbi:MAG: hypothetical protein AB8G26_17015 [Ilumatobacter sp.]
MLKQTNGANRPFWMHQLVEYLLGAVFISTALGSSTPLIPSAIGAIVIVNAAIAVGPGGAFRLIHRRTHKYVDMVIMALIVFAVVQPFVSIDANARLVMGLLGVVFAFVWYNSDFATKDERQTRRVKTARPDAEATGRSAGRTAAEGYLAAKRLKKAVTDKRSEPE